MAGPADHEGLSSPFRHELRPGRLRSSRSGEVGEFADLVDFHRGPVFAELAPARLEPGDQFLAALQERQVGCFAGDVDEGERYLLAAFDRAERGAGEAAAVGDCRGVGVEEGDEGCDVDAGTIGRSISSMAARTNSTRSPRMAGCVATRSAPPPSRPSSMRTG
jgi:hypothetical protein